MEIVFQLLEIENQAWIAGWGGHQSCIFPHRPRPINPQKPGTTSANGNAFTSTLFDLQRKRKKWPHPLARLGASPPSWPPPIQKATRAKEIKEKQKRIMEYRTSEFRAKPKSLDPSPPRPITPPKPHGTSLPRYSIFSERERGDPTHSSDHPPTVWSIHLLHGAPPIQKATRAKERKEKQKKQVRDRELTK